jgi:hypothetical protein
LLQPCVHGGFFRYDLSSAAVNLDRLFQPLISLPNFLELGIGKRWRPVITNWNVLDVKSDCSIVGNQIHPMRFVESQFLLVK